MMSERHCILHLDIWRSSLVYICVVCAHAHECVYVCVRVCLCVPHIYYLHTVYIHIYSIYQVYIIYTYIKYIYVYIYNVYTYKHSEKAVALECSKSAGEKYQRESRRRPSPTSSYCRHHAVPS